MYLPGKYKKLVCYQGTRRRRQRRDKTQNTRQEAVLVCGGKGNAGKEGNQGETSQCKNSEADGETIKKASSNVSGRGK